MYASVYQSNKGFIQIEQDLGDMKWQIKEI